jgi:hypothetical protein
VNQSWASAAENFNLIPVVQRADYRGPAHLNRERANTVAVGVILLEAKGKNLYGLLEQSGGSTRDLTKLF